MSLTIDHTLDILRNIARGKIDARLGERWLVDQAGEAMMTSHTWSWAAQGTYLAALVTGQTYAELPANTRQVEHVLYVPAPARPVRAASFAQIQTWRVVENGVPDAAIIHYNVRYGQPPTADGGPPSVRLELYPVPTDDQNEALEVSLVTGWRRIEADDDAVYLQLPEFMEPLFLMYLRATVDGYVRDAGDINKLLGSYEAITRSRFASEAKVADGASQPVLGQPSGGALQRYRMTGDAFIDHNPNSPTSAFDVT